MMEVMFHKARYHSFSIFGDKPYRLLVESARFETEDAMLAAFAQLQIDILAGDFKKFNPEGKEIE